MSIINITKWTKRRQNTLRGFVDVAFGPSLLIHDAAIHERDGKAWASLPSKPMVARDGTVMKDAAGKIRYVPIVSWSDKAAAERFSRAVIDALVAEHPDALS